MAFRNSSICTRAVACLASFVLSVLLHHGGAWFRTRSSSGPLGSEESRWVSWCLLLRMCLPPASPPSFFNLCFSSPVLGRHWSFPLQKPGGYVKRVPYFPLKHLSDKSNSLVFLTIFWSLQTLREKVVQWLEIGSCLPWLYLRGEGFRRTPPFTLRALAYSPGNSAGPVGDFYGFPNLHFF